MLPFDLTGSVFLFFLYVFSCLIVNERWSTKSKGGRMYGADGTPIIILWPFVLVSFIILIWPMDGMKRLMKVRVPSLKRSYKEVK